MLSPSLILTPGIAPSFSSQYTLIIIRSYLALYLFWGSNIPDLQPILRVKGGVLAKKKITIISKPSEYFKQLTLQAATSAGLSYTQDALDYIASLLNRSLKSRPNEETQGLMAVSLMSALEKTPIEQLRVSQQVGDISLTVAGVFSDSLNKKLLNIEYYVEMGTTGYQLAHQLSQTHESETLFWELSNRFSIYLEILHRVAHKVGLINAKNILNIYEKWLQTQSPHFKKLLAANGIILTPTKQNQEH